jgi:alcohol dehydrogenase class IV
MLVAFRDGSDLKARTGMALAAYLSGVTLANAGLGLVHGFSSSVGGYFNIPHGVICSALMAPVNRITVRRLRKEHRHGDALKKYATAGRLFSGTPNKPDDYYVDVLLSTIEHAAREMGIPKLSAHSVFPGQFPRIIAETRNKNNPVDFVKEEMFEALEAATYG